MILLLALSLAVAVFAYVPPLVGTAVTVLFTLALLVLAFSYGNAAVRVDDDSLTVGRFRLEGTWIKDAEALEGADAANAIGAGSNPRDFLQTRPYVRDLVRVELADPADPHPHWIVSSRNAEQLAGAIRGIAGGRA